MSEPVRQVALEAVDLTIGTAAALCRVAAPPVRLALRTARRTPGVASAARALQDGGRVLRLRALEVAVAELGVLVPATVAAVLDRLDLTDLVVRRVDLDRVVLELDIDAVLDRLDLTDLVVRRVDLDRVVQELDVDALLNRLDLTGIVVTRVDLNRVVQGLDVDAVVARADLEAAVARLDLIGLAEYVVDGIDLPKIIRESSGTVASEGLRQVRLSSFEADRAVAQFVDRLLLRRGARGDGPVPGAGPGADGARA